MKANDLIGRKFGRLKVLDREKSDTRGNAMWKCECDCGNTTVICGYNLLNGHAQSCGCLKKEKTIEV